MLIDCCTLPLTFAGVIIHDKYQVVIGLEVHTQLLTQSSWKFKTAFAGSSDISSSIQTCQKDNVLTFAVALSGTLDEGGTKCNAADPQTNPFTWTFKSSETILFISTTLFTGGSSTFTLVSLDENELVVSQVITPIGGPSFLATVTFTH